MLPCNIKLACNLQTQPPGCLCTELNGKVASLNTASHLSNCRKSLVRKIGYQMGASQGRGGNRGVAVIQVWFGRSKHIKGHIGQQQARLGAAGIG